MAISDLVNEPSEKVRKGPPCTVCQMLADLPDSESAALLRLLSDKTRRYSTLADDLRGEGHDVTAGTLSRHARGLCEARVKLR